MAPMLTRLGAYIGRRRRADPDQCPGPIETPGFSSALQSASECRRTRGGDLNSPQCFGFRQVAYNTQVCPKDAGVRRLDRGDLSPCFEKFP